MYHLLDFNSVLGKILFITLILIATHIHMLAGVGMLLLIISMNHNVREGMENKNNTSDEISSDDADDADDADDSNDSNDATDATDATDVNVSDVNGDDVDTLISSFKTDNCKNGLLMKDDKEVTMDSITKLFPSLKFLGETCNPCDDDCKFEIVSSSERLTAEENVTPVDSTTIPVDREALTKKQDE